MSEPRKARPNAAAGPPAGDPLAAYVATSTRYAGIDYGPSKPTSSGSSTSWLIPLAGLVVVGALGWFGMKAFKGRSNGESIHRIRNYPSEFANQTVTVRGKVGDVFQVGGSYAYYLRQDRDTIVVFTRGSRPQEQRTVSVKGSISVGYMDGVPRPALFATE